MVKKILILLAILSCTGCIGPKFSKKPVEKLRVPDVVESFDIVDRDGNGTIDKEEYYSNAVSINTDQPTSGLLWIMLSVLTCTLGSAVVYRKRSEGKCK